MGCYSGTIPTSRSDVATRFLSFPGAASPTTTRVRFPSSKLMATASSVSLPTASLDSMSFYELLGIQETGTLIEIKQAYKQLARKYHPDVSPPDLIEENTRAFIRVQEAYEILSDPRKRVLYDRDLARGLHLAFSARRRYQSDSPMDFDDKAEWRSRWESQITGLKRRSNEKGMENTSWAARMRKQRERNDRH